MCNTERPRLALGRGTVARQFSTVNIWPQCNSNADIVMLSVSPMVIPMLVMHPAVAGVPMHADGTQTLGPVSGLPDSA